MHEWHTSKSTNIQRLISEFENFKFETDYGGREEVSRVKVTSRLFRDEASTIDFVTKSSYGSNTAYIASYYDGKISKAFQNAFNNFLEKRKDYEDFSDNLTIAYGRKASKVTCPNCGSSITLSYGKKFKSCPVCGSKKIISDSNWHTLETKKKLVEKASEHLKVEAEKCNVTFVCGIEWHC